MAHTIDPRHFNQKAAHIRAQAAGVLKRWGLLPRFKRWRLTQDPDTGLVVLFGVLNNSYIATHTSTPFNAYFNPNLLHDLANELQVQVVSCNGDVLRYAFILDRGQIGVVPTHIDYPFVEDDRLFARVIYSNQPAPDVIELEPPTTHPVDMVGNQTLVNQGVGAFLKVFDDIKLRDDLASQISAQIPPDIIVIDKDEFDKRVAEHDIDPQRTQPTRQPPKTATG